MIWSSHYITTNCHPSIYVVNRFSTPWSLLDCITEIIHGQGEVSNTDKMIKRSLNLETYLNQLTEEASVSTSSHACKRKKKKKKRKNLFFFRCPLSLRLGTRKLRRWWWIGGPRLIFMLEHPSRQHNGVSICNCHTWWWRIRFRARSLTTSEDFSVWEQFPTSGIHTDIWQISYHAAMKIARALHW